MAITGMADTFVAVGNTDDMSNIITNISPSETPILSGSGRTKATAVFHAWLEDALRAPAVNAKVEGGEFEAIEPEPRVWKGNWTQIMSAGYAVTGTQEVVAKTGVKSELGYQMQKAAKELALDHEYALLRNGAGSAGAGDTRVHGQLYGPESATQGDMVRKFTDIPTFITTNVISGAFTEDILNQAVQKSWEAGGTPKRAYMSANNKRKASTFSMPNRSVEVDQHDKKMTVAVRFYESDFGVIELLPHRLMPDTMVLVLDPSYIKLADLRPVHREQIAKTSDALNGVLLGETTLEVRAEKAHAKITVTP